MASQEPTSKDKGWISSRFSRLSTGLKMLLILSVGLFPLGLVAILASVQSARENAVSRNDDIRTHIQLSAQRLNAAIVRSALTLRAASAAVDSTNANARICDDTLRRLAILAGSPGHYALFNEDGALQCATRGYAAPRIAARPGTSSAVELTENGDALRYMMFGNNGVVEGVGEYPREALAKLADVTGARSDVDLTLAGAGRQMILKNNHRGGTLMRSVRLSQPIADGRLQLQITAGAVPISAAELLMILLPILMWISAAIIGWLIVDRLLLRPLVRMQGAVAAYKPGDSALDLPNLSTPAREIGDLGDAFDQVTKTVARHEAELEAAVDRQTRLVREVHHRVKNNLQVVASLLNLHSRGSRNEDVAAAYASIQRRVDALAVVHRNHYAELEENRGVALKPLISELGANLRATAPASASGMVVSLNIEPYYVTQDVAVSVAFLITEMVEFAMFCSAAAVRVSLSANDVGTATLLVESDSLRSDTVCDPDLFQRFDRIVTGLSRQLRSAIDRDTDLGSYSLAIAVVDKAER